MKSKHILFTGGGSGGHVYPLVAVAREIEKLAIEAHATVELYYMGPADTYSARLAATGIKTSPIVSAKLRRYFSFSNIFDIPKFFIGLVQAFFKLYFLMPDVIFSKGGTGALPVILAGFFYRVPIVIHESDATPGLTNMISAKFATRIAVAFELAAKSFNPALTAHVGSPVRGEFFINKMSAEAAKEKLGFVADEPLILVIGGSQGAERLNNFILENIPAMLVEGQVLHQTGTANYADVDKLSRAALSDLSIEIEKKHPYKAVPYIEEMQVALSAADVVVSRAGAGSIFEMAALGRPSILIPHSGDASSGHQRVNAYEYAKTGAAVVIEEDNLLPRIFINQIRDILKTPGVAQKMSAAAESFFKPQAAKILAEEILRIAYRQG